MKQPSPLEICPQTLARIKTLASAARRLPDGERALYLAIKVLPAAQQAELLALYQLGQSSRTAFNTNVASAKREDPQFIAGRLAEKANLLRFLRAGLKRYSLQFNKTVKPITTYE
jgi:hypothetical protein